MKPCPKEEEDKKIGESVCQGEDALHPRCDGKMRGKRSEVDKDLQRNLNYFIQLQSLPFGLLTGRPMSRFFCPPTSWRPTDATSITWTPAKMQGQHELCSEHFPGFSHSPSNPGKTIGYGSAFPQTSQWWKNRGQTERWMVEGHCCYPTDMSLCTALFRLCSILHWLE